MSGSGKSFLSSSQSRDVIRAMAKTGQPLTREVGTQYIADLFDMATHYVRDCAVGGAAGFWAAIGEKVPWASTIGGEELYQLSLMFISARMMYHNDIEDIALLQESSYSGSEERPKIPRDHNAANTAIDGFTNAIIETYGRGSTVRDVFFPYVSYFRAFYLFLLLLFSLSLL